MPRSLSRLSLSGTLVLAAVGFVLVVAIAIIVLFGQSAGPARQAAAEIVAALDADWIRQTRRFDVEHRKVCAAIVEAICQGDLQRLQRVIDDLEKHPSHPHFWEKVADLVDCALHQSKSGYRLRASGFSIQPGIALGADRPWEALAGEPLLIITARSAATVREHVPDSDGYWLQPVDTNPDELLKLMSREIVANVNSSADN